MDKLLTIIVPMYNMRDYIVECLSSLVLTQNMEYLEVLVINDGSTDNSYELAHEFELKYPETFRVITKKNGHYGSCINRGLQEATGKYIKVLDADDYFLTKSFSCLMKYLKSTDVDIVITDTKRVFHDHESWKPFTFVKNQEFDILDQCTSDEVIKMIMHDVTYKRQIFIDSNYKQTEGVMYTDNEWTFVPLAMVRKAFYLPYIVYMYRMGREGQSMDVNVMSRSYSHFLKMAMSLVSNRSNINNHIPKQMQIMLDLRLLRILKMVYKYILINSKDFYNEQLIQLDSLLKEKNPKIYTKIGNRKLSTPLFPFKYIKIWRKNHDSKFLRLIITVYRKYKSIK